MKRSEKYPDADWEQEMHRPKDVVIDDFMDRVDDYVIASISYRTAFGSLTTLEKAKQELRQLLEELIS